MSGHAADIGGAGRASSLIEGVLLRDKVIAILRGVRGPRVDAIIGALLEGGIRFIEITLEADGGLDTLLAVRARVGAGGVLGAGSITTASQAEAALTAGARYLVSPGFFDDVSSVARAHDVLYIPGVATATEIGIALRHGHRLLKLFPAGLMGTDYLKALRAPYPSARFLAVGNIGVGDVGRFLAAGAAGVGMGSQLVGGDDDASEIARKTRAILTQIREASLA